MYNLGEGEERTELLVTYIDGDSKISDRIASSPRIKLYKENEEVCMDITDSDRVSDRYEYTKLKPLNAVFEQPEHPDYELGDLTINLPEGKLLGISQFYREE
ncbi:hypothetical protein CMI46_02315 [Candidatus Pacearchaeota archaeon]|nr:hypothetical protein [Candidatus Pacearchaeota archaeon]